MKPTGTNVRFQFANNLKERTMCRCGTNQNSFTSHHKYVIFGVCIRFCVIENRLLIFHACALRARLCNIPLQCATKITHEFH